MVMRHLYILFAAVCGGEMFTCANRMCIDITRVCDGFPDCYQAEDEANCSMLLILFMHSAVNVGLL